jgi:protein MpaA
MLNNYRIPRQKRGYINHVVKVYGKSNLGMSLEVFLPQKEKARYLVIAGQHGNEAETTVLLSSALRSIPSELLRCAVILNMNPDGLAHGTRCNAAGVDLNRNFPASNWSPKEAYYSWNDEHPRDTELSPGVKPASEPETRELLNLLKDLKPEAVISLHSPLNCIDDPQNTDLAKSLSREMNLPLVPNIGYATPGSFGSWAKENGLTLITIELPFDTIQNIRRRFSPSLEKLLMGEL